MLTSTSPVAILQRSRYFCPPDLNALVALFIICAEIQSQGSLQSEQRGGKSWSGNVT